MKSFISRSFSSQLNLFDNTSNIRQIETSIERGVDCRVLLLPNDSNQTNNLSQEHLLPPESFFIPRANGDTWSQSPSVTFSYAQEWYRLFGLNQSDQNGDSRLQQYAIAGRLRNSRFRSICWRVFLGVLSPDSSNWKAELESHRQRFASISHVWNKNPGGQMSDDHPLASDRSSSWNQYFRSMQIKRIIIQDVERTFPNVEYFRKPQVREIMINILYLYSVHTGVPYRQGMHEILAPLLFVLHCDLTAFSHAQESNLVPPELLEKLAIFLDSQYFEADCFTMFAKIMNQIYKWYYSNSDKLISTESLDLEITNNVVLPGPSFYNSPGDPILFNSTNDESQCPGVSFAESIHKNLLSKYDYDLYLHLKRLEIAPAFFGVRWIRLLFGYEFPLQDLVYIWDCIFAVDDHYSFVPFMYVSMLLFLSPLLMNRGYSDCLSLLMRFPSGADVTGLIYTALHLYKPDVYPAPICLLKQQSQPPAEQTKKSAARRYASFSRVQKALPLADPSHMRTRSLSRRTSTVDESAVADISRKNINRNRMFSGSTTNLNRTSFLKEIFNHSAKSFSANASSPVTDQPIVRTLLTRNPLSHLEIPKSAICDTDRTTTSVNNVKQLLRAVRTLMKICINSLHECSDTLSLMLNQSSHPSIKLPFETSDNSMDVSSLQLQLIKLLENKLKSTQKSMLDFVRDDLYDFENHFSNSTDYEPDQSLLELVDSLVTADSLDKPLDLSSWTMLQNDPDILGPPGAMLPMGPMQ